MKPVVKCCAIGANEGPHLPILEQAGFEVSPRPVDADLFNADVIRQVISGSAAIIAGAEPYTREIIEATPTLRVIARSGVGFDAVDLEACDDHGIVVTTTPGVNHHAVAELAIALLMGVARGFPGLDQRVRTGNWVRQPTPRVMGTTLGLVGLGRIGKAVVPRAIGLGMKVLATEPFPDEEFCRQHDIELLPVEKLLSRADYVSLHNPLSAETQHYMNAERFAQMKPGAVLINTSRGGLVDERALCAALDSGHLRGAGLDVFEVEPLPLDSPLLTFPGVLLSGHVAGIDQEARHDTLVMAAETIVGLRDGRWPEECIQNLRGVEGWKW